MSSIISKNTNSIHDIKTYFQTAELDAFQKSSSGSTGMTYLPNDSDFHWVVKWQLPVLAETELVCTEFYRRSFENLSVPQLKLEVNLQEILMPFFQKKNVFSRRYVPTLIERKRGQKLDTFYKEGKFRELNDVELKKLFLSLGEIAFFDILIGNSDRFTPSNFRGEINYSHRANEGNVLIELVIPNNPNAAPIIRNVHAIDNAPRPYSFFDLRERGELDLSDSDSDFEYDVFEDEKKTASPPQRSSIIQSLRDNRPSNTYNIVRGKENLPRASNSGESVRRRKKQMFKFLMQCKRGTIEILAKQILIGIINSLKDTIPDETTNIDEFFNNPVMVQGLTIGLLKARKQLKTNKNRCLNVLQEIRTGRNYQPYHESTIKVINFIKSNLGNLGEAAK